MLKAILKISCQNNAIISKKTLIFKTPNLLKEMLFSACFKYN
jgi:hypothetical protein